MGFWPGGIPHGEHRSCPDAEPHLDDTAIARKHRDCFIAGEGHHRVLNRTQGAEIEAMVRSMVGTAKLTGGYMMCVGNDIPWNTCPEGIRGYLDLSEGPAKR